ncbi:MAG TPA: TIGR03960 family B12-binding radical SAM protein [Rectinemataceae bacterium]|nr:TIGR03960 family B12-binding radical SAM protein [Rectinemataceae bacterium]
MRPRIRPLDDLGSRLLSVEKPARYLGGEYGSIRKEGEGYLDFALCFPDLYEIGMSNNAIRILYQGLNSLPGLRCERVFAPAPDFEALLEAEGLPLYTLETGIPLSTVDILGFSFGYELAATSMLAVLKAGQIPLHAEERGGDSPIVIAGGPAISNPHPFARFLDAAYIGEAESSFFALAADVASMKAAGAGRSELLERLSRDPAVWLPAREGRPAKSATRAVFAGFADFDYRTAFPVATLKTVQDHGTVEIMRGCPNGCRFCHAGYYYRPQRIKSYAQIRSEVEHLVSQGGHREITLSSLSSGDYPCVDQLLAALNAEWGSRRVSFQLPSLKVNSFTLPIIKELSEVRKAGLTFAVETPVDEWQRGINKDVSYEHTLAILREAKSKGFRLAKFYFMLGLPVAGRGQGEVDAITEFFDRLIAAVHIELHATIGVFVPKPHTPFQWSGQLGESEGLALITELRTRLRRHRNLRLSYHSPFLSMLEGVVSRGDERVGELIELAFARGARLDAWEDRFDRELWRGVLSEASWPVESESCAERKTEAPLPWDDIRIRQSKGSLLRELERAKAQQSTSACAENCNEPCGSCDEAHHVAVVDPGIPVKLVQEPLRPPETAVTARLLFAYSRRGPARFYPHLAVVEAISRAFLMADIPVSYSEGFNPAPRLELLQPLPLGLGSEEDLGLVTVSEAIGETDFLNNMNTRLPEGVQLHAARIIESRPGVKQSSLGSRLWGSEFRLHFERSEGQAALAERIRYELEAAPMDQARVELASATEILLRLPNPPSKEYGLMKLLERCLEPDPVFHALKIVRTRALALKDGEPASFFELQD